MEHDETRKVKINKTDNDLTIDKQPRRDSTSSLSSMEVPEC